MVRSQTPISPEIHLLSPVQEAGEARPLVLRILEGVYQFFNHSQPGPLAVPEPQTPILN